jgi:hypothetical protein
MRIIEADLSTLEPEQWSDALAVPLPKKAVGRRTLALLVALRIYIFIAVPLVIFAFVRSLHG